MLTHMGPAMHQREGQKKDEGRSAVTNETPSKSASATYVRMYAFIHVVCAGSVCICGVTGPRSKHSYSWVLVTLPSRKNE